MKIIDMHCDTLMALQEKKQNGLPFTFKTSDTQVNLANMADSHYMLQNFAVFVDTGSADDPFEHAMRMISLYYGQLEQHADMIAPAYTYDDIIKNDRAGKMTALLTLEEGGICKGEPEFLDILYRLGARMMTITWNYENELGFPNVSRGEEWNRPGEFSRRGLKEKGLIFLEEMERLGMIIDVSHLSDAGFYDVLDHTKKPFVASHSNARSVCSAMRNLTDDMIRKLADRGGVAGINFCQDFLGTPEKGKNYLQQAVKHMKYLVNVGGEDFVGLGSDFDGIPPYDDFKDCRVVPLLADYMKKEGFSYRQIEKIFFQNVLRLYRDLL